MPKMKSNRGAAKPLPEDRIGKAHAEAGLQVPHPHQEEPETEAAAPYGYVVTAAADVKRVRRMLPGT